MNSLRPQNKPITVKQLIRVLESLPHQGRPIFMEGSQKGYEYASTIDEQWIELDIHSKPSSPHGKAPDPIDADALGYVIVRHD